MPLGIRQHELLARHSQSAVNAVTGDARGIIHNGKAFNDLLNSIDFPIWA